MNQYWKRIVFSSLMMNTIISTSTIAQEPNHLKDPSYQIDRAEDNTQKSYSSESCYTSGLSRQAQCYSLKRPLFVADADGDSITLGGIIAPAQAPTSLTDPLIILVGGPGQGASDMTGALLPLFNKVRNKRDIVFFDIRGTGKSSPLACSPEKKLSPLTHVSIEEMITQIKICTQDKARQITSYTSMTAVADLESLRMALGAERINLWGASYGTRLAQLYMRSHPERVRTAVLDGLVPFKPSYIQTQDTNAFVSLKTLIEDCKQSIECNKAFPEFNPIELLDRLGDREPIRYQHPVTGDEIVTVTSRSVVAQTLFSNLYKTQSRAFIPWILTQAVEHNEWGPMATLAVDSGEYLGVKSLYTGAYFSVVCSGELRRNPAEHRQADVRSPAYAFSKGVPRKQLKTLCDNWPVSGVAEVLPGPTKAAEEIPVFLISGALDPITPPVMADSIIVEFPKSRHLIIEKGGHINSDRPCMRDLISDFLSDPTDAFKTIDGNKICENEVFSMPFVTNTLGAFVRGNRND